MRHCVFSAPCLQFYVFPTVSMSVSLPPCLPLCRPVGSPISFSLCLCLCVLENPPVSTKCLRSLHSYIIKGCHENFVSVFFIKQLPLILIGTPRNELEFFRLFMELLVFVTDSHANISGLYRSRTSPQPNFTVTLAFSK